MYKMHVWSNIHCFIGNTRLCFDIQSADYVSSDVTGAAAVIRTRLLHFCRVLA